MALTEAFEAVQTEFRALIPDVPLRFGGEYLAENEAPPRAVWVPTADTYGPPEIHETTGYVLGEGARPLYECIASVAIHLWGRSTAEVELLRDTMITALRRAAAAAFSVQAGSWVQPEHTVLQSGRAYVLLVTFPVPILEVTSGTGLATITVAGTAATNDVAFDPPPGP